MWRISSFETSCEPKVQSIATQFTQIQSCKRLTVSIAIPSLSCVFPMNLLMPLMYSLWITFMFLLPLLQVASGPTQHLHDGVLVLRAAPSDSHLVPAPLLILSGVSHCVPPFWSPWPPMVVPTSAEFAASLSPPLVLDRSEISATKRFF